MWNDFVPSRDAETASNYRDKFGFRDAKGVAWSVNCRDIPERQGRIEVDFFSATGRRRSSQLKAEQIEQLRKMSDQEWRALLANAAVIELE